MGDLPIMSHSNTFVKLMGDLLQNIVIPSIIRWPYSVLSKFCPHIGNTKESKDPVLFHPIPLLEIFSFF